MRWAAKLNHLGIAKLLVEQAAAINYKAKVSTSKLLLGPVPHKVLAPFSRITVDVVPKSMILKRGFAVALQP